MDCNMFRLNPAGSVTVLIYCSPYALGTANVAVTGYEEIFQQYLSRPKLKILFGGPLYLKLLLLNFVLTHFSPKGFFTIKSA